MSERPADWPERLNAFLEQRRHAPFVWGENDCALFAADAVRSITELDPLGGLRGAWSDASQAARQMAAMGGLVEACNQLLGDPLVGLPAACAPRGAVVCVDVEPGRPTLGIAAGNGCWCAPGEAGLVFRPMSEVALAWVV